MSSLYREEIGFSVKASGVAGEAAVPAYDAVAGDDEGDGISSDGASDGAGVEGRALGQVFAQCLRRSLFFRRGSRRGSSIRKGETECR